MRHVIVLLATGLMLGSCASTAETAALNAGAYEYCVAQAARADVDAKAKCGPDAASYEPSFGDKWDYLRSPPNPNDPYYRFLAQQQAARPQPVQLTAAEQATNLCVTATMPTLTRNGSFSEYLSNLSVARAYCLTHGNVSPPLPPPPQYIPAPSYPTQTICRQAGGTVICNSQ